MKRGPVRTILCILYATAALFLLSRWGLLPRYLSFPQKDNGISPYSVFYYIGNSFTNYVRHEDEKKIPVGAIDKLELFSTSNKDQGGYYDPSENRFYYYLNNVVFSFEEPKKKARKVIILGLNSWMINRLLQQELMEIRMTYGSIRKAVVN